MVGHGNQGFQLQKESLFGQETCLEFKCVLSFLNKINLHWSAFHFVLFVALKFIKVILVSSWTDWTVK